MTSLCIFYSFGFHLVLWIFFIIFKYKNVIFTFLYKYMLRNKIFTFTLIKIIRGRNSLVKKNFCFVFLKINFIYIWILTCTQIYICWYSVTYYVLLFLFFSEHIAVCKLLLSLLLKMTRKIGSTMNLVKEMCRDIHSQLDDIDKVGNSVFSTIFYWSWSKPRIMQAAISLWKLFFLNLSLYYFSNKRAVIKCLIYSNKTYIIFWKNVAFVKKEDYKL